MRYIIILLLGITLLAGSSRTLAQTVGTGPGRTVVVPGGTSTGGSYRLASPGLPQAQGDAWQVSGTVTGGDYTLTSAYAPVLRDNGCCCTYLPCLLRHW